MTIQGIWYNPKTNEIIEIQPVYSLWLNCCVQYKNGSKYYNINESFLIEKCWVRIGDL